MSGTPDPNPGHICLHRVPLCYVIVVMLPVPNGEPPIPVGEIIFKDYAGSESIDTTERFVFALPEHWVEFRDKTEFTKYESFNPMAVMRSSVSDNENHDHLRRKTRDTLFQIHDLIPRAFIRSSNKAFHGIEIHVRDFIDNYPDRSSFANNTQLSVQERLDQCLKVRNRGAFAILASIFRRTWTDFLAIVAENKVKVAEDKVEVATKQPKARSGDLPPKRILKEARGTACKIENVVKALYLDHCKLQQLLEDNEHTIANLKKIEGLHEPQSIQDMLENVHAEFPNSERTHLESLKKSQRHRNPLVVLLLR
ncbi:hypothetical protein GLAREA_10923 [Glarea lozoyensis ATCC 20868]|uniref:Uncharacterized protein n=1 Tax=Glarea lozoyensis (strain ATCC 20868 / MF5171) TaxID=1116229 RepID=S3DTF8_GLAL2|nr:uncharacterized protein GLAREA_10923 [Glarea lozoyensis ATCC 20868]EPE35226.1 hypothetical protein GLAREA_10923 [Glarea lozoyensis ATCC 20868]